MKNIMFFGIVLAAFACHERNKNTVSTADLMKSREIKKVSEAEILKEGTTFGNELMDAMQVIISNKVNPKQTDCNIENWTVLDSMSQANRVIIQKVSNKSENKSDLVYQLLEAYQYNLDHDLAATPAIQKLDPATVLYTFPIGKESPIFKYCLDSAAQASAGMWAIKIPIKKIINRL